jgi:hypothetical protein
MSAGPFSTHRPVSRLVCEDDALYPPGSYEAAGNGHDNPPLALSSMPSGSVFQGCLKSPGSRKVRHALADGLLVD